MGYINYEPSFNPFKGSHVILFNFSEDLKPAPKSERKPKNEPLIDLVTEQALNKSCTSSGTGTEQALVPSINYINNTNILNNKNVSNLQKHTKNFEEINNTSEDNVLPYCHPELVEGPQKEEKSSAKKEEKLQPSTEQVKTYFQENNFPELEAQKFFNYFTSIGWLVGGKTPMTNWQAAAQNWMINAPKFFPNPEQPNRAKNLNTTTEKNYAEPL
ncbi:MAG: transcriptional regulator [Flavobacterium sp.]